LKHTLVFHLIGLSKKLQKAIGLNSPASSLSYSQATSLLVLDANAKVSQIDLAKTLHLQPASIVPLIDELEGLNLVKRHTHPQNRRAYQILLTDLGKKEAKKVKKQTSRIENFVKSKLTSFEYQAFTQAVNKLSAGLDNPDNQNPKSQEVKT